MLRDSEYFTAGGSCVAAHGRIFNGLPGAPGGPFYA